MGFSDRYGMLLVFKLDVWEFAALSEVCDVRILGGCFRQFMRSGLELSNCGPTG